MAKSTATVLALMCAACGGDDDAFDASPPPDAAAAIDAVVPDAAPPSPADLEGLVLWLDAEDLAALTDEDPVLAWPDRSGQSNDAASADPTAPGARWKRFEANGKATVRFDGVGAHLVATDLLDGQGDVTIFAVARRDGGVAGAGSALVDWTGSGGLQVTLDYGRFLGQPRFRVADALERAVAFSETTRDELAVISARQNAGTVDLYVDGGREAVGAPAPHDNLGAAELRIGAAPPDRFAGDISELLIYDRALTDDERQFVEQLLLAEYAIEPASDTAYLPNQVPGIRLWLNPSFVDQLPDTEVTAWLDYSGGLNDGALGSAAGPTLIDDPVFGKLLRFSGAEQFQLADDPVAGTTAFSVFAVARRDAGAGTGSAIVGLREAGPSGCMLDYAGSGGANPRFLVRDSAGLAGAAQSPDPRTDLIIIEGALSGTTVTVRVNGEPKSAVDGGFSGTFAWDDYAIGAANGGTPVLFGGDVGEVLVFERVLSTPERDALEAYLRAKHNIP